MKLPLVTSLLLALSLSLSAHAVETKQATAQIDALIEYVKAEVWPGVTAAKGFMSGEVLRSFGEGGDRLLLVTRWKDTKSLPGFLGPDWQAHQMTPVTAEEPVLVGIGIYTHRTSTISWLLLGP